VVFRVTVAAVLAPHHRLHIGGGSVFNRVQYIHDATGTARRIAYEIDKLAFAVLAPIAVDAVDIVLALNESLAFDVAHSSTPPIRFIYALLLPLFNGVGNAINHEGSTANAERPDHNRQAN
jgi:hypothetical protein